MLTYAHVAVKQLVWAHSNGPAQVRTVATEYFVRHWRRIRKEARETMQLLKQLPSDVTVELMESLVD